MATEARGDAPIVETRSEIEATMDGLETVHRQLERFWAEADAPAPDETWRVLFESAVAEVAGNIIRHAQPPHVFYLSLRAFPGRVEATLLDQGIPYQLVPVRTSVDMRPAMTEPDMDHGWGLAIARAVTDGIVYDRLDSGHNRWVIEKRLPA
jgi:anti-sigma regulatory factor (Ser/Thr protein kinase)